MKTELTKLEQIKKLVGMTIDLAEMKLDDGVTVIEAEVFEAGQEVFVKAEDGQSIPLPVGEYGMEDGMVLVVSEEGIIGEIREPQAEEEAADQEQGVAAAEKPAAKPIAKKVVESVSKETYFSAEEKEALIARIDALEAKLSEQEKEEEVVEMKEETAKPIVHNPENRTEVKITKLAANRKGETVADRVRNTLFN
jgi:hypothetical protein